MRTVQEQQLSFSFLPSSSIGVNIKKEKKKFFKEKTPFWRGFFVQGNKLKVTKVVFLCKMTEKYGGVPIPLTLLHSERPKLNTILAFLSAKG